MMKDRKLWVVVALAVALLMATSPPSFGAVSFGLKVVGYTTSANVVYVSVANLSLSTLTGTVSVSAVVNGAQVKAYASFSAAAGSTTVVPVSLAGSPSKIIGCGASSDGSTPI